MVLHVDSDAAYLILPNAGSRYAGHFFLGDTPPPPPATPSPKPNGDIWSDTDRLRRSLEPSILNLLTHTPHNLVS